jgi:two-component system KDP operon response regulator KdpE
VNATSSPVRWPGAPVAGSVALVEQEAAVRALIVADDSERRDALAGEVQRAGHEIAGLSDAEHVTAEIWRAVSAGPDALIIDLGEDLAALRHLIDRARHAADRPLPAVLLLPEHSPWIRGPLPADLLPAIAISARDARSGSLTAALAAAGPDSGGAAAEIPAPPQQPVASSLSLDRQRREVEGPEGATHLTPSEASILSLLVREEGGVVSHQRLAQELWGSAFSDRHSRAAIRSHVHTLRAKLRAVGLADVVASMPGVGYRLNAGATG